MAVLFHAIYDRRSSTLRPLEKVDLPEGELLVIVHPAKEQPSLNGQHLPVQQTLADVLGFDPSDEEKSMQLAESQYQAMQAALSSTQSTGLDQSMSLLPPSDSDLDSILYGDEDV